MDMNIMGKKEDSILYFTHSGQENTTDLLEYVFRKAKEKEIKTVIIPSETGKSALKAEEIFHNSDIKLVVVTQIPNTYWSPKGTILTGLLRKEYSDRREKLVNQGVTIIQGNPPVYTLSRSLEWTAPTPELYIEKTLEIFGSGLKTAVQIVLMATDQGVLKPGERVISCGGTYLGLDTAIVTEASYTRNFFTDFTIQEILAKPLQRVKQLPEYEDSAWKGNLEEYYEK